jgi:site-specific recombinase XerD
MTTLPQLSASSTVPTLRAELSQAVNFALAEKSPATRRAYRSDYDLFRGWCEDKGVPALPAGPETVAAFLAAEASRGIKPSTLGRRLAAIRYAHKLAGHEPPTNAECVKATVRGIRRSLGTAKVRKAPVLAQTAVSMALASPATLKGLRDRALLLLGFAGAFRRSELVALDASDMEETQDGLRITIRRSKTDQEGEGATIAIVRGSVTCPVAALRAWMDAAAVQEGPLFRSVRKGGKIGGRLSAKSVAGVVKSHAERLGLNVAEFAGQFAALRVSDQRCAARRIRIQDA